MALKVRVYEGEYIDVSYDVKRCIHAAECVKGLPAVFDPAKRPWVQVDQASADEIAATIRKCPTGALKYTRKDSGKPEGMPAANAILITENGPYFVHGNVEIKSMNEEDGAHEARLALCRCGGSENKPYCDNKHKETGFVAGSAVANNQTETSAPENYGVLNLTPATNGPLLLQGNFEIRDASGEHIYRGDKAALCRCGGSANKPFCDGAHKTNGFVT